MIMKHSWLNFTPLVLLLAAGLSVSSDTLLAQAPPPQKIDVSKLNYREDDVVIPVPSEIFNALDKLGGNPNWKSAVAPVNTKLHPTKEPDIGLLLGTVIANGFIAVQAKDASQVKDVGRRVLVLSKSLGVEREVVSHCNSINEAADNNDWQAIRSEFDKAQSSVRSAMERLNSKDISELISMGGWLRGTDALTSLISKEYTADRAELLHQPELVHTFDSQLGHMQPKFKANPMVVKVQETLKEIRPLVDMPDPDQKTVEKLNSLTVELLKTISP